jgi:hypothetical protein
VQVEQRLQRKRELLGPEASARAWLEAVPVRGRFSVWKAVRARGWHAEIRPLRADRGGVEAFVVPCSQRQFRFVVDDSSSDLSRGGERSRVAEFRLAHEVGHTLFYKPGAPPTRRRPPDADEERFCDDFARALLSFM